MALANVIALTPKPLNKANTVKRSYLFSAISTNTQRYGAIQLKSKLKNWIEYPWTETIFIFLELFLDYYSLVEASN